MSTAIVPANMDEALKMLESAAGFLADVPTMVTLREGHDVAYLHEPRAPAEPTDRARCRVYAKWGDPSGTPILEAEQDRCQAVCDRMTAALDDC